MNFVDFDVFVPMPLYKVRDQVEGSSFLYTKASGKNLGGILVMYLMFPSWSIL